MLAIAVSATNVTKRGVVEQTHVYGETVGFKPVTFYQNPATLPIPNPSNDNYFAENAKLAAFEKPTYENERNKANTASQLNYTPNPVTTTQFQFLPQSAGIHSSNLNFKPSVQEQSGFSQTTPEIVKTSAQDYRQHYSSTPLRPNAGPTNQDASNYYPYPSSSQIVYGNQQIPNNPQYGFQSPSNQYQSETVVAPVQHSTSINHGIFNPVVPTLPVIHPTQTPLILGKYIFSNGKIIFNPLNSQTTPQLNTPPLPLYPKPQTAFNPAFNPYKALTKLTPPNPIAPNNFNYQQQHTKINIEPTKAPVKELEKESKENKKTEKEKDLEEEEDEEAENVKEESFEENDSDEVSDFKEDDDNNHHYYRKPYHSSHRYDDDEDESHERYEEDDDDHNEREHYFDDNKRGSSKHYHSKPKKYHKVEYKPYKQIESGDKYKFKESYSSKSKNGKPVKGFYKHFDDREPKTQYKAYKYSKSSEKPKIDIVESKESQNIPVIHKQKIYKEKWFVTKSHDM